MITWYSSESPALDAPGPDLQLGLAYGHEMWAYPMNTVLTTVAFLLLLDTNLCSPAAITHYSQLHDTTPPTKIIVTLQVEREKRRKLMSVEKSHKSSHACPMF